MIKYIVDLIYPVLCASCDNALGANELLLCSGCKAELPIVSRDNLTDTTLSDKLFGRIELVSSFSYLTFHKDNITQNLVHRLKYQKQKIIGQTLGQWFGESIKNQINQNKPDLIIPIPIHSGKLKDRGYNQSEVICQGITKSIKIPICYKNKTEKITNQERQVRKNV